MISPRQSEDNLDDDTLPVSAYPERQTPAPRDVRILDFKDRRSQVTVVHGPLDPSRVWVYFENHQASVQLSLQEGTARLLWEELGTVLSCFAEVRSTIPDRGPFDGLSPLQPRNP